MDLVFSVHRVPIRLTSERWLHIVESHDELAGRYYDILETIMRPAYVVKGDEGELLALSDEPGEKLLVVAYREIDSKDGFVVTAFITSKREKFLGRCILWPK